MKIAGREIGTGRRVYVIAEIGVNHDGSGARAVELVHAAHRAGADAVKFQFFRAELLMSGEAALASYQKDAGEVDPVTMLRRLELPIDRLAYAVREAHALGLHAIVTPFSLELIGECATLPWDAYKSASPDIVNEPLLSGVAALGKPLIVSTGASTLEEVERAVGWLAPARGRLALLQCVSSYPTPLENAALEGIAALARVFEGPVGYSDHTREEGTSQVAVEQGACILEKHLTYSRRASGPDHAASLEPAGFARYVELARRTLAPAPPPGGLKEVLEIERDVRRVSRQSLTAARDLSPGTVLTRGDLVIRRPGTGLAPWMLPRITGRTLGRKVEKGVPITADDITGFHV